MDETKKDKVLRLFMGASEATPPTTIYISICGGPITAGRDVNIYVSSSHDIMPQDPPQSRVRDD